MPLRHRLCRYLEPHCARLPKLLKLQPLCRLPLLLFLLEPRDLCAQLRLCLPLSSLVLMPHLFLLLLEALLLLLQLLLKLLQL